MKTKSPQLNHALQWGVVPLSKLDERICWVALTLAVVESVFFVLQAGFAHYQIFTNTILFFGVFFVYGALKKGIISGGGVYHFKSDSDFYKRLLPFFCFWYGFVMLACFMLHQQERAELHEKVTLSLLLHRALF